MKNKTMKMSKRCASMKKICSGGVLAAALCTILLCGCGQDGAQTAENTLGEIQVVAREEGSGTKTQFEECLGIYGAQPDVVAESTVDVLTEVEKTPAAIGYVASTAVQDASVKALAVDKIKPEIANIKNGKYPLSRDYSLVYTGNLNELQEDFLRYVGSAGQKLVEDFCIPAKKEQTFLSNQAKGTLSICGSSSMEGVMQALVEEYQGLNPNAAITLEITDSADGIQKAMQGKCDMGMSSRALRPYEAELLECFVVGRDGIAVIVNKENVIEQITTKQLISIYTEESADWKELR